MQLPPIGSSQTDYSSPAPNPTQQAMALGIQLAILNAQQQIRQDQEELSATPPPSPQQTAALLTQLTTAENALNSMIPQQQSFARETGIDYSNLTTPSDLTKQLQ